VNRVDSVGAAPAAGSCGTPALKYSTASRTFVNEPLWRKVRASLSCRIVTTRNLKAAASCLVISFRPIVVVIRIISRQPVQGLKRVVANPDVDEVLFHGLTDPGNVLVVVLHVEHGSAVAGEAARPARAPPVAGVKNSSAPRSWLSVSARLSPARNRRRACSG
jgi:hypothetical protein